MSGPLDGLRVVEFAGVGPCPHAAMMMADLGADVVRLDRPSGGFDLADTGGDVTQRGRTSVTVDLKSPADRAHVLELIRSADVVVEGFRPGVLERLGLGPDVCLAANQALIFGRITGWGQSGPLAQRAGHDINYLSVTGTLSALGSPDRPSFPLNLLADFGGGSMLLTIGVLAALVERSRSGKGQVVDAAMVDGVAQLSQMLWSMRGQGQWNDVRGTNVLDGGAPFYDVYRCADGKFIAVGALEPKFYASLLEGLSISPDDLPDQYDREGWPVLRKTLDETISRRSRDEWAEVFAERDACVTPVVELSEAVDQHHLAARETLHVLDGTIQAAPAPRFARTPNDPKPRESITSAIEEAIEKWSAVD